MIIARSRPPRDTAVVKFNPRIVEALQVAFPMARKEESSRFGTYYSLYVGFACFPDEYLKQIAGTVFEFDGKHYRVTNWYKTKTFATIVILPSDYKEYMKQNNTH